MQDVDHPTIRVISPTEHFMPIYVAIYYGDLLWLRDKFCDSNRTIPIAAYILTSKTGRLTQLHHTDWSKVHYIIMTLVTEVIYFIQYIPYAL